MISLLSRDTEAMASLAPSLHLKVSPCPRGCQRTLEHGIGEVAAHHQVTLVKTEQGWALVAKDGKALGYVAAERLHKLQIGTNCPAQNKTDEVVRAMARARRGAAEHKTVQLLRGLDTWPICDSALLLEPVR